MALFYRTIVLLSRNKIIKVRQEQRRGDRVEANDAPDARSRKSPDGIEAVAGQRRRMCFVERMVNEGVFRNLPPTPRLFTLKNLLDPNERPCQQRFIEPLQEGVRRTGAISDCVSARSRFA